MPNMKRHQDVPNISKGGTPLVIKTSSWWLTHRTRSPDRRTLSSDHASSDHMHLDFILRRPSAKRDERDVNRLEDQEIFELFIDKFIFCSLTAEKPIFRETSMFKFSIFHLPFRSYLRNPHLMYEKEHAKTSKTTGRKKWKIIAYKTSTLPPNYGTTSRNT